MHCYGLNVSPPKPQIHVEALTLEVGSLGGNQV